MPLTELELAERSQRGDLAVTTDYRDVLGEVCLKRLNNPNLSAVFPDYSVKVGEILKPR